MFYKWYELVRKRVKPNMKYGEFVFYCVIIFTIASYFVGYAIGSTYSHVVNNR
ncbi:hypothetical protein Bcell_0602 [Evansella cellulosilytica DSM 2522]|uniref:Uncharacterized protein n=1 Tax=Evansella cellulosilytica (strain ATCC 21833 / DSM 2522 / FERM P-1141 / JCM 9156 / N-4) TaxID=649639 RepID=E6TYE6_EVAC2|nr:hypothetical protein Bcell_0602 [Evansella cellulosilytica DSM 2522]